MIKRKTIVINGLSARRGGGQTYLINLFRFFDYSREARIIALVPPQHNHRFIYPGIEIHSPQLSADGIIPRLLWEKIKLPALLASLGADVLYCPGGVLSPSRPPRSCRTAVAFRNMLPFAPSERKRYPFRYYRFRLLALKFLQSRSFDRADLVIFLSQYAQSIIDGYLPHRRGRSLVIPHGINEHFHYQPERPFPPNLPPDYVLYVSILDVYKAQLEVIQAWHRLQARRPTKEKLVLIGPAYPSYGKKVHNLIKSLGLENDVLVLGEVPYAALPSYYHHAKITIFASSCENCPNILLEALASGRPVLSSSFQPMPEFGREAAAYFNPYQPDQLTDLLIEYLDNEGLRVIMGQKARSRAEDFQWPRSARQTWEALLELAAP